MAGMLPVKPELFKPIPDAKVAIIASMWHRDLIQEMIESCQQCMTEFLQLDENNIEIHFLPGAYELPFAAQTLLTSKPNLDAIVAFGIVLKGDTTHDASVIQSVVNGFSHVSLKFSKPIINEVIGVLNMNDARVRAVSKGQEAAFALSEVLHWQKLVSLP